MFGRRFDSAQLHNRWLLKGKSIFCLGNRSNEKRNQDAIASWLLRGLSREISPSPAIARVPKGVARKIWFQIFDLLMPSLSMVLLRKRVEGISQLYLTTTYVQAKMGLTRF